ncbi:hypothetical protein AB0L34_12590 [Micromonospora sp. NPDC052213]|uniref:hypothetical protein n=1 Tax=Micromonospora sp. NPDC052213 TaxID=3155812 RepID=UPI0034403DC9
MHITIFTVGIRHNPPPDEALLLDAMWAHIRPEDRVEHVRIRAGPGQLSVALFLLAPDQRHAQKSTDEIRQRIADLPLFRN